MSDATPGSEHVGTAAPLGAAPTGRALVVLVATTAPPALLAVLDLRFAVLAALVNVLWFAAVWLEARTLPGPATFGVRRSFERTPRAGVPVSLELRLQPPAAGGLRWQLTQPWPLGWTAERPATRDPEEAASSVQRLEQPLGDGAGLEATLVATPGRRGPVALPPTRIGVSRGFPGLAVRRHELREPAFVGVQLDASGVSTWDRLRRSRSLTGVGAHRQRRLGEGAEFDQLREYTPGDDHRDIDWKATARNGRPITTTFRAERQRDVVLALDTGRLMNLGFGDDAASSAAGLLGVGATRTRLDAAVQTALLIAHVAAAEGDRVGLATFAERIDTWVPPGGGPAARRRLAEALAAAEARSTYTDFAALVATIRQRRSHRSLVLLFTDLEDPQLAADLAAALPPLARRHAVVVLSLRDAALDRLADGAEPTDAATALAARRLVTERDAHLVDLRRRGVTVVHPEPGRLALAAIDAYLAGKRKAFG